MGSGVVVDSQTDSTFGCLLLAGIFSTALWGAGSVQLCYYYDNYSKVDKWWLKSYMLLLYALDTLHQILLLVSLFSYYVEGFTGNSNLEELQRPLCGTIILMAIIGFLTQCLFVMRIWHLSKGNRVLSGIFSTLVVGQFAATAFYFGEAYTHPKVPHIAVAETSEWMMNLVTAFVDIAITSTLAFLLHSGRSGIKQTDSIVGRLIIYIISTGIATSVLSLLALITYVTNPGSLIVWVFLLVIPKLYLNSALALLNSRQKLRDGLANSLENGIVLNDLHLETDRKGTVAGEDSLVSEVIHVRVDTSVWTSSTGPDDKDPWQKA